MNSCIRQSLDQYKFDMSVITIKHAIIIQVPRQKWTPGPKLGVNKATGPCEIGS